MLPDLMARRDRAADRHDEAKRRDPTQTSPQFAAEARAVMEELDAICRAMDPGVSDPAELAKAYRWLGDAWFDVAHGHDRAALLRGVTAYRRAEALIAGTDAPVEAAKLAFNYANTLRALAAGNPTLLQAAMRRYRTAAGVFRGHGLADLVARAETQLAILEPQIGLARGFAQQGVRTVSVHHFAR